MTVPNKKEIGPIIGGAGIFVVCTYAAIHQFIFPRSEAEAAIMEANHRIERMEISQTNDRKEYLEGMREIRDYIINNRK